MYPYPGDKKATELIYAKHGQLNVYSHILNFNLEPDVKYPSPFRNDGRMPSFNVYLDKEVYRWNDHGSLDDKLPILQRDCIGLLMQLKNITRIEACTELWKSKIEPTVIPEIKVKSEYFLSIRKNWNNYEWDWWDFIDRSLLSKHRIYPTEKLEIGSTLIKSSPTSPSFTYLYEKPSWKVYSPFLTVNKWKSFEMKKVVDGWAQLPYKGDTLYIVSSKKDGLVMQTYLGVSFIAPPSENNFQEILNRSHIINSRFKNIVVSLDGDKTGVISTNHISEITGWDKVVLCSDNKLIKDQTEVLNKLGVLKLKSIYGS